MREAITKVMTNISPSVCLPCLYLLASEPVILYHLFIEDEHTQSDSHIQAKLNAKKTFSDKTKKGRLQYAAEDSCSTTPPPTKFQISQCASCLPGLCAISSVFWSAYPPVCPLSMTSIVD